VRIVLSWLREFCPTDLAPEELGDLLASKGMHVESIERPWEGLKGVVVARVLEVRDHPKADTLCLARIDVGAAEREVVVGVRSMKPGDLVPYAGVGARVPVLPEPLGAREIRGVVSEGMLCSARELNVSADHSGILVLSEASVGEDVKRTFGLDDIVLDLEIETNRPDLLSVLGVAREVAGATGLPLTPPDTSVAEDDAVSAASAAWVEVQDAERCPRYLARVIRGSAVTPSPTRVQARLSAAGMRAQSSVVDATNYAMLEMGQPMHPFDLDLLAGGGVVVRRAREGEEIVTLDDVERELVPDDLVIADREKSVGIAGVMGSAAAEVSQSTSVVLLESAHFEPRGILRTSRRLQLPTEAAIRFSRGSDPEAVGSAADRAARLMMDWGSGAVLAGVIDLGGAPPHRKVTIRPARASAVIGHDVSAAEVAEALGRIGIPTEKQDGVIVAEAPSFRPDVEREEDLIEEVARAQGYEQLRSTLPGIKQAGGVAPTYAFRRRVREALVRAGLREALSLSFASPTDLELMGHADAVRIANPPSADEPFLRRSLVPNLLEALTGTLRRGGRGAALFEIGNVFHPADPVDEREMAAAVMAGPSGSGPHAEPRALDFFDAKGVVESLMAALAIERWTVGAPVGAPYHPGRSASIDVDGRPAGVVAELDPRVAERLDLPPRVGVIEVDVSAVRSSARATVTYRDVPRFPPVRRDLAFVVDTATAAGHVQAALEDAADDLVGSAILFDVHSGAPLPQGKKSLAFSLDFRAPDRTLTDAEANAAVAKIVERLANDFGAELRAG
jgi:phenylalanyl-tRNA synthetase beta chain